MPDFEKMMGRKEIKPDEYDTWDMEIDFSVKEHASGSPWLLIETLRGPYLPILGDGFLGLEFQPGTDLATAKQIQKLVREHLCRITYTGPKTGAISDQLGRGGLRQLREKNKDQK